MSSKQSSNQTAACNKFIENEINSWTILDGYIFMPPSEQLENALKNQFETAFKAALNRSTGRVTIKFTTLSEQDIRNDPLAALDQIKAKALYENWLIMGGSIYLPPSDELKQAIREEYESLIKLFCEDIKIDLLTSPRNNDIYMDIDVGPTNLNDLELHRSQSLKETLVNETKRNMLQMIQDNENPEECRSKVLTILDSIRTAIEEITLKV